MVVVPEPGLLPPENVEPMSPHRMLLKTTCVVGLFWRMREGLPSVVEQGPLLPVSSQFMKPLASFQIAKVRTTDFIRARFIGFGGWEDGGRIYNAQCRTLVFRGIGVVYSLPRASALPDVARPPKAATELSSELHISEVSVSPPELALAMSTPFWRYFLVMEVSVPEAVPSLVLNCVTTVNGLFVSTVPPGP